MSNKIDISNMSKEELMELQKTIGSELDKRNSCKKASLNIYGRLYTEFKDIAEENNIDPDDAGFLSLIANMERGIIKICDITIGNYTINSNGQSPIKSVPRTIPCGMRDIYSDMVDDIFDNITSYREKAKNYGN